MSKSNLLLINANAKEEKEYPLKGFPLADQSVHCAVFSPPYYALRDYGTANWQGGDPKCDHKKGKPEHRSRNKSTINYSESQEHNLESWGDRCHKCGAVRIDQQIGLEASPEAYVQAMVEVMREVWRVLRDDGTVWLNISDSYWGGKGASAQAWSTEHQNRKTLEKKQHQITSKGEMRPTDGKHPTIKTGDLIGIPWMLAFALRADGWYLRAENIWSKTNPMPESIGNRPTRSHEQIFLLTKSMKPYKWVHQNTGEVVFKKPKPDYRWIRLDNDREIIPETDISHNGESDWKRFNLWDGRSYFYDQDAIREPLQMSSVKRISEPNFDNQTGGAKDPRNGGEGSRHRSARQGLVGLKKKHMKNHEYDGQKPNIVYINRANGNGELESNPAGRNKWTVWEVAEDEYLQFLQWKESHRRDKRDVWTFSTQPYSGSHFATYPVDLVIPCIKAGTSEMGCCPKCGAQWERVVEHSVVSRDDAARTFIVDARDKNADKNDQGSNRAKDGHKPGYVSSNKTLGWQASCNCNAGDPVPCIVFDPFVGSGTTLQAARQLGRSGVGLDLSLKYLQEEARERLKLTALDDYKKGNAKPAKNDISKLPLFKGIK